MRTIITVFLLGIGLLPWSAGGEALSQQEQLKVLIQEVQTLRGQVQEMKSLHQQQAEEIQRLKKQVESGAVKSGASSEDDLAALRALATAESKKAPVESETEKTTFKAGSLGLQALNPEISVTGDLVSTYNHRDSVNDANKATFRGLGLHFESYLDPYTHFKAAVPVNENEAKIGEAYLTRFGVVQDVNLTLGKFRQQFGVVNRWHKHALDQVDFPLALRQIFGNGGLNQTGLSLDWNLPPVGNTSQALTLQVTNGENDRLFGDNSWETPSVLLHYKNYRDLNESTYLELGATSLVGWNDEWQVYNPNQPQINWRDKHDKLATWVFGGDMSLRWEPTDKMRYRNIEWRTEWYYLHRGIRNPFTTHREAIESWGLYSYVQAKVAREWDIGIRYDFYEPDSKWYAETPGLSLTPLAYADKDAYRWQVGPYVTWQQSPFVRFRLEYNHEDGRNMGEPVDRIMLQAIFAAGPHKHERY